MPDKHEDRIGSEENTPFGRSTVGAVTSLWADVSQYQGMLDCSVLETSRSPVVVLIPGGSWHRLKFSQSDFSPHTTEQEGTWAMMPRERLLDIVRGDMTGQGVTSASRQ